MTLKKLQKIISGAQTGVDRSALDIAIWLGFEYGGWCPKGRLDEKGKIPEKYQHLKEISGEFKTDKENYDARTIKNIKDSDATLIIVPKIPLPKNISDGTVLTIKEAKLQKKTFLVIDLSKSNHANAELISSWIKENKISVLNIAGPRESSCPGIYESSLELLKITLPSVQLKMKTFIVILLSIVSILLFLNLVTPISNDVPSIKLFVFNNKDMSCGHWRKQANKE